MAQYVNVTGAMEALEAITEEFQINQSLHWIGFGTESMKDNLYDDSISSFSDLFTMNFDDVDTMAKDYVNRTLILGKLNFGIRRIKKLKVLLHWAQDFFCISERPSMEGMTVEDFLMQLDRALERTKVRKQYRDDSDKKVKEASPGPLKSEQEWIDWEAKFANYCLGLVGVNGVLLSYVIRENDNPPTDGRQYAIFVNYKVYCAPLSGSYYDVNKQTVHQLLLSFTTGQPYEYWIKGVSRYRDGRRSMQALRDHFSGEGNSTRIIAEADRMNKSLHYKNKRSLSFEIFLTKCQKMFNIYDKEVEPMLEDVKLRFLFDRIQDSLRNKGWV